jgi:hypothetical protein
MKPEEQHRPLARPRLEPISPVVLVAGAELDDLQAALGDRLVHAVNDPLSLRATARATRAPVCVCVATDDPDRARSVVDAARDALRWVPAIVVSSSSRGWQDRRGTREGIAALNSTAALPRLLDQLEWRLIERFKRVGEFCMSLRMRPAWSELLWRLSIGVPHTALPGALGLARGTVRKDLKTMIELAQVAYPDDLVATVNGGRLYESLTDLLPRRADGATA